MAVAPILPYNTHVPRAMRATLALPAAIRMQEGGHQKVGQSEWIVKEEKWQVWPWSCSEENPNQEEMVNFLPWAPPWVKSSEGDDASEV